MRGGRVILLTKILGCTVESRKLEVLETRD